MKQLSKVALFIIDECLLIDISTEQNAFVLEIVEMLYQLKSIIFSQIDSHGCPQILSNGTVSESSMDRIVHTFIQLIIVDERYL